ncbi:MAG: 6-phosphogluconolactonase [Thermodesulfobacteriota bacterium]
MSERKISIHEDLESLSRAAAETFLDLSVRAVRAKGSFSAVLSGGATPRTLYGLLAAPPFKEKIPWRDTDLFWGDERCVPPDHPESNYRMAEEAFLSRVPIPPENVHRMRGELDPAEGAKRYEDEIRGFFKGKGGEGGGALPVFDLVILGLGEDGHTLSLFPSTAAPDTSPGTSHGKSERLVVGSRVEKPGGHRLTMTLPLVNNASNVLFLVSGAGKAGVLKEVLEAPPRPELYPAEGVNPVKGGLIWLVDKAAAGFLTKIKET